jgi:hypothetical protein
MAFRGKTHVGTPVNSIKAPLNQGMRAGTPSGMQGTVNRQFQGDQRGNRQEGISTGTPYVSRDGNSPEARRVASQGHYGHVVDTATREDMNDPRSNGDGVVLDGMSQDYGDPTHKPTMDSPVPTHAPVFQTRHILEENAAHLGSGSGKTAPNAANARDNLLNVGGVMSRGMVTTHKAHQSRDEAILTTDDTKL